MRTLRSVNDGGPDVVEITIGKASDSKPGYYTMLNSDESSPESMDDEKQRKLWAKSLEWGRITQDNTVLKTAF